MATLLPWLWSISLRPGEIGLKWKALRCVFQPESRDVYRWVGWKYVVVLSFCRCDKGWISWGLERRRNGCRRQRNMSENENYACLIRVTLTRGRTSSTVVSSLLLHLNTQTNSCYIIFTAMTRLAAHQKTEQWLSRRRKGRNRVSAWQRKAIPKLWYSKVC